MTKSGTGVVISLLVVDIGYSFFFTCLFACHHVDLLATHSIPDAI